MLYNQQTKQTKHKATPAPENIATRLKGPVRDPTKKTTPLGLWGEHLGHGRFSTGSMCLSLKTSLEFRDPGGKHVTC